jgi:hypothetical protein
MTHALSKFAAIAVGAAVLGASGAVLAAPKPHNPNPINGGGDASPGPGDPAADLTADPHVIYALEQLVTGAIPSEVIAKLAPLRSLREVEDLLKTNNIAFKWDRVQMHSSAVPPKIIKQMTALPPGEVFVVPQGSPPGQIMVFNVILATRPDVTP